MSAAIQVSTLSTFNPCFQEVLREKNPIEEVMETGSLGWTGWTPLDGTAWSRQPTIRAIGSHPAIAVVQCPRVSS